MTTLGFERGSSATTSHRRFEREYDQIVDIATRNGAIEEPVIRQRLMAQYTRIQILRYNGLRSLTKNVNELDDRQKAGVSALGACNKMSWSETHRDTMDLAMDVLGLESQILTGSGDEEFVPGVGKREAARDYPVSRSRRRSSSPAPRRSGAARQRSSATSSVNASSVCRRNRSPRTR